MLEEELERFFLKGAADEVPAQGVGALSQNEALRAAAQNISRLAGSLLQYTVGMAELSQRIAHDLVQRIGSLFNDSNEARALHTLDLLRVKMRHMPPEQQYRLSKHSGITGAGAGAVAETIISMLERTKDIRRQALELRLKKAVERALADYEGRVYRSIIRSILPPIMKDLLNDVINLHKITEKMEYYFGISSAGWDYKNGQWQEIPWDIFKRGRQLLDDDPSLMRLAKILGRGYKQGLADSAVNNLEAEYISKQEYRGKMEILGVNFGKDINLILPSQYAQFSDPDTEYRFYKELLDGQLLVSHYQSQEDRKVNKYQPREHERTLGPVIICLDTSGSMAGWPETVAKSFCLALLNICWEAGRSVYLILFSTEVRELDLSDMNSSVPEFARFFALEFRGGTDLSPALRASLRMFAEKRYTDADLLIISDFRIPKVMLENDLAWDAIREQSRIHVLTIGKHPVEDTFNMFDTQWHYRISAQNEPMGISGLVEIFSRGEAVHSGSVRNS